MKKKKKIIIILLVSLVVLLIGCYILYRNIYLDKKKLLISLNGEENIILKYNDKYVEHYSKASFRNKDLSSNIKINGKVNTNKLGTYKITYSIKVNGIGKSIYKEKVRKVEVIDDEKPIINLNGDNKITLNIGEEYKELGYNAIDNYDGDITDKVIITNNINKDKEGEYEILYKVSDSSSNSTEIKRNIIYRKKEIKKALPSMNGNASKIAVLNYHLFYDEAKESGNQSIFISTKKFEEQLKYLKENNYKTLTMKEFKSWMYGEIELPKRSVLITVDDGAAGTGFHNGNKLIPLLEKYDAKATLFLITSWWDKSNYVSKNLEIESHTNDMHTEGFCKNVTRGAKMLCLSDDEVLKDLKTSVDILGTNTAFAYPFYAYSEKAVELLKQTGFKLAFIGGNYKATRKINKYKIPRYPIQKNITLTQFINMIS